MLRDFLGREKTIRRKTSDKKALRNPHSENSEILSKMASQAKPAFFTTEKTEATDTTEARQEGRLIDE
jgi:hypothetical protein